MFGGWRHGAKSRLGYKQRGVDVDAPLAAQRNWLTSTQLGTCGHQATDRRINAASFSILVGQPKDECQVKFSSRWRVLNDSAAQRRIVHCDYG